MRQSSRAAVAAMAATAAGAANLTDVCTVANVQAALPANGSLPGISLISSAVTANAVTTQPASTGGFPFLHKRQMGPGSSAPFVPYCNVTVTYARPGDLNDVVLLLAFPEPATYANRWYVAGGQGYSLNSDATGGLAYGAVGGATDAGYDAFNNQLTDVVLLSNGSLNWDAINMFGYEALGEMTLVGKAIAPAFYGSNKSAKLYTYYEGCSDGGREGMSQIQRWGEHYDGAITGAPAFRQAQQQVNHLFPTVAEQTLGYYPPECELAKIVNATIEACDPLDGRTDGVIARSDLCQLQFNMSSIIGQSYHCAASTSTSLGFGFSGLKKRQFGSTTSSTPEQNGTVTAEGVAVAQAIVDGLHSSSGERAYLSWRIGSEFSDAATTYDNETNTWGPTITSLGGEFVTKFVEKVDLDNLESLDGVTYDTLIDWMNTAYYRFLNSLQTTVPDLKTFKQSGGKLIHYHGESDPSVPAGSSIHYWQGVRSVMGETNLQKFADWYQLYLIPGAAHCGANSLQPGPYPQNNMDIMIDWVENGNKPSRLNATVASGPYTNETQLLCQFPTRPLWKDNSSTFDCVTDEESIKTWTLDFPAFNTTIY